LKRFISDASWGSKGNAREEGRQAGGSILYLVLGAVGASDPGLLKLANGEISLSTRDGGVTGQKEYC